MTNKEELQEMIRIYKPENKDWMGYKIYHTKNNHAKLTYHHIDEERNGGKSSLENGAILTVKSHCILHKVEHHFPQLYAAWQDLFIEINSLKGPMTENLLARRASLLKITKEFLSYLEIRRDLHETKESATKIMFSNP